MNKEIGREESINLWEKNADGWTELSRLGYDICRDGLNAPAFLKMLPDVNGLFGIDIGCGEGTNTRLVAGQGAKLIGIDPSKKFIEHAGSHAENEKLNLSYQVGSADCLEFEDQTFDFAISTMCLMDLPDLSAALSECYRVLKANGFLQFSIVHPCFSPPGVRWMKDEDGADEGVLVGRYFEEGSFLEEWSFSAVPEELSEKHGNFKVAHYHRTLSSWLNLIINTGFQIEEVNEPYPDQKAVERYPGLKKLQEVSWFLHIRARRGV